MGNLVRENGNGGDGKEEMGDTGKVKISSSGKPWRRGGGGSGSGSR